MRTVKVVEHHRVDVPVDPRPRTVEDYAAILTELAVRLDTGRVYDRDLPTLEPGVTAVLEAMTRRYL
ncbi:hypothetical protein JQN72_14775 [Phycicoccus sp. CSK15P-2]|uniref:hypothetical protein n=1 Tax=Phycicoccus sp. CSK15P-2 TaxID=2807627 RepID=UPI001951A3B3|nr:hypothetical protein [Phycicoccus sp. CSK15P-2]MBM6405507.1 hypothetical protein [Phycicoccus sp. CSK15P-2]